MYMSVSTIDKHYMYIYTYIVQLRIWLTFSFVIIFLLCLCNITVMMWCSWLERRQYCQNSNISIQAWYFQQKKSVGQMNWQ